MNEMNQTSIEILDKLSDNLESEADNQAKQLCNEMINIADSCNDSREEIALARLQIDARKHVLSYITSKQTADRMNKLLNLTDQELNEKIRLLST